MYIENYSINNIQMMDVPKQSWNICDQDNYEERQIDQEEGTSNDHMAWDCFGVHQDNFLCKTRVINELFCWLKNKERRLNIQVLFVQTPKHSWSFSMLTFEDMHKTEPYMTMPTLSFQS